MTSISSAPSRRRGTVMTQRNAGEPGRLTGPEPRHATVAYGAAA